MRKCFVTLASAFFILAIGAVPLSAAPIGFINGADGTYGESTPPLFQDTVGGITATFNSSALGPFTAESTTDGLVSTWGPEALVAFSPATLTIQFSQPLNSIAVDFGALAPLDLTAFLGLSQVAGTPIEITGTFQVASGLFEGTNFTFSGANFDKVELSTTGSALAIGNITINADPVPEPSTVILVGAGILLLLGGFGSRHVAV
jgi:hypothetical protein